MDSSRFVDLPREPVECRRKAFSRNRLEQVSRRLDPAGRVARGICCLLFFSAMLSCAKVGDPLPPLPADSVLVDDLEIVLAGNDLLLTFPFFDRELSEVEVYRVCEGDGDDIRISSPEKIFSAEEIGRLPFLKRSYVRIPQEESGVHCSYAVRTRGVRGGRSDFSNQVSWTSIDPPPPPQRLSAGASETKVRIKWEPPNLESDESEIEYLIDFREISVDETWNSSEFIFGEQLSLEVRTLLRRQGTILLSEPAVLTGFVPRDSFPPRPPSGLIQVRLKDRVQLSWDENREPDLAGYFVYRSRGKSEPEKISPRLGFSRFVDEAPPEQGNTSYFVTAVDKWGNESEMSTVSER